MNAGVSARVTVFEGGRRLREWDQSQAEILAAEAGQIDTRFGVILQTQNSFFGALRQAELLEVQRARVARAEESLSNIRQQVQLGVATRSDTLRARLEVANARLAEIQAETALRGAEFALGRQVGEDGPVSPISPPNMGPAPLSLTDEQIYLIAVEESPAVRAAQANRTAANASASASKAAYWPSLSLNSGYSWSNNAVALADGNTSWNLGISASVPVFNGFTREENISRAEQGARVARYQEDDARLAARQNADAALQALRTAELTAEIAGEAVVVAAEDLRVVEQRYRLGVGTILDLITSQVAIEQAEADLVVARYDYVLARAELEALLGRTL
jgi:outer membrane protein TolC